MYHDMNNIPTELPDDPQLQQLIAEGWGEVMEFDHGDIKTGFHFLSFEDMERMGEETRIRLGVQAHYLFALEHQQAE